MTPQQGWPKGAEGKELQQAMLPGEQVLMWAQGRGGALLVASDQRALIIKTGMMSTGQPFGHKIAVWPYRQIISVDLQTTFGSGWVEIVTAGSQARRGGFNKAAVAVTADNMVAFLGSDKPWRPLVNVLRERIQQALQPAPQVAYAPPQPVMPPPPAPPSIPDQIAQLAQLRDQGILSPEEFEAKKAELLARM